MKTYLFLLVLVLPFIVNAQTPSQTENYILTTTYQNGYLKGSEQNATDSEKITGIKYFDGLGRLDESVSVRAGGASQDIVTHVEYDALGRQGKEYLPYAATTNGGAYRTDALTATNSFYNTAKYENTTNPYSEKLFEASPLNRVLEQTSPGTSWQAGTVFDSNGHSNGHTIKLLNQTNTTNEVKLFGVSLTFSSNTYTPTLTGGTTYYLAGELSKTITKDENWKSTQTYINDNTTEEFKDKQGQVVLKRTYNEGAKHDTYYVYDDYGNLTYVLSPKMGATTATLSTINSLLNELGYQYKYDNRNRLVEKKIPGKGWEYIVYDNLDRPVLTQDANLKAQNKWLFTKYDVFGRVVYTGLFTQNITRDALQTIFNNKTALQNYEAKVTTGTGYDNSYYSNDNYPNTSIEIQTINYYDNYFFDKVAGNPEVSYGVTPLTDVKGLATGSKVKVLTTSSWITTVNYYDSKARPIYVYSTNAYLGTTDKVKSELDFVGKVIETTTTHSKTGDNDITTVDKFTYDHAGRLTKQTQTIGAVTPEVIVENHYDELGQLVSKGVGGKTSRLQTVDYTYNIRGWLKQINNPSSLGTDLFGFKINYNTVSHSGTPLYNGNIAETEWETQNDNVLRWYRYSYDALNRIISATDNINRYNLSNVSYDKNGNIKTLNRGGHTNEFATNFSPNMDILTYNYQDNNNSNKLLNVNDSGYENYGFKEQSNTTTEYTYDANGNMLKDLNKGITTNILYNHLNLPTQITFAADKYINYIYDASGIKLEKVVTEGSTVTRTKYAGNYIYENDVLKFFNQPEGYVEPSGSTFNYIYQYKDHLGNIRLSYFDKNNDGVITVSADPLLTEIVEENNYYPFGLEHKGYNSDINGTHHKYMFGGKEFDESFNRTLNTYDFGARNYDPALGRWMNIDPLAEKMRRHSPYNYAFNNPIYFIDPDGMAPMSGDGDYYGVNGNYLGNDGIDDDKVYVADSKTIEKITNDDGTETTETTFNNAEELSVSHSKFRKQAATVYAESSIGYGIEDKKEMFSIASVHQKNKIAFGANAPLAKKFLNTSVDDQTGSMQTANAAVINAVKGGIDYSNGADQWDGAEQAMVSKANMDKASNGRFMFKMNVMGWNIGESHFKSWKSAIDNKFGKGKFTVPKVKKALHNYGGMKNNGKIRLNSTAQYGLSIFWKTN